MCNGGSLFHTGIMIDSQIFSSAAQDFSSFPQELSSTHRLCLPAEVERNHVLVVLVIKILFPRI